jgi:hypothetical protein
LEKLRVAVSQSSASDDPYAWGVRPLARAGLDRAGTWLSEASGRKQSGLRVSW